MDGWMELRCICHFGYDEVFWLRGTSLGLVLVPGKRTLALRARGRQRVVMGLQDRGRWRALRNTREEKARKVQQSLSDEEDEEEPELILSQEEKLICYPVGKIKKFLSDTKGQRAVRTESFFPDLNGFIRSVNRFTKENVFSEQEVYRLMKLVTKAKSALLEDIG
ncbi:hypothetical protein D4764_14G0004520 [Takifugu flavidus]|uniref:Uncharacterized protein n=1 Tax=Takifugu flavidus TaxID=433684 RepID=A0A5C6P696_9TELE|nr:hypothetical protein D4764_14G0004520 [Takifugu flavidus]